MAHIDTLCVEVTAKCPLRCVHCSASAAPERMEMLDPALFERSLRGLERLEELYLSGGEPFEHPSLTTIIQASRRVARNVIVYTSGVRMVASGNAPLPIEGLGAVKRVGVSRIDVSLYAAQAEAHDAVTQTDGSFALTLETLRRLRAEQIPFGIHHVPLTGASHVLPIARLAQDLGAVRLHVLSLAPQGRGRSLGALELPKGARAELYRLLDEPKPFELVLSSGVRRALGLTAATPRDALLPAMLDVRGFLYPSEGQRLPMLRSRSAVGERSFRELVAELHGS